MKTKPHLMLIIIIVLGLIVSGCNTKKVIPQVMPLEESIKEIIISKGENYDFVSDELYIDKMEELINTITNKLKSINIVYTIGNLDEDSIPELAVFVERDPDNTSDQGLLQIYKFNGEKYNLIDEISMNFDNNNYQLIIGKISDEQNGLLLNNQVGAHSGITYGYILKDNKLVSILNEKKLNLLSIYTSNEIKDIDDDGILEFSIYAMDPESIEESSVGSDKITYWYKWDGKDGGELVRFDREKDYILDEDIYDEFKNLLKDPQEALNYLKEKKTQVSKMDNTRLLMDYIEELESLKDQKSIEIEKLFNKYQSGSNFDHIINKYGLSIDRLNDREYLKREKTLQNEIELKEHLLKNLDLGYKLMSSEGIYYYEINHSLLGEIFENNISREFRDYIKILALDTKEPFLIDGSLMISHEKLMDRIVLLENFKLTYPYSTHLDAVEEIYNNYIKIFIYGDYHTPNFDENNKVDEKILNIWDECINKYPNSYFSEILSNL